MPSEPSSPGRRSLTPEKSKINFKSEHIYEIIGDIISSTDIQFLPPGLIEFRIICDTFYLESDLVTQFRGNKLAIYVNNLVVCQSCTIDLSGIPRDPFNCDAGRDSEGRGKDGLNGSAGDSGGNFALISKIAEFENGSRLTIISNGSDGMNGQDAGNGDNGRNGKDATEHSFKVKGFDWGMFSPLSAENRELYEKFGLKTSQSSTSHSNVTTDDGLFGQVFVQPYNNEEYGLMLVKGEEPGFPGKLGGRGGLGGHCGLAGNIFIKIGQDEQQKNIIKIQNPGKAGQDGIGGLNGSKGRIGGDFLKYHTTTMQDDPVCFGQDSPTKFKVEWGEARNYSIYDTEKCQFVYAVEDYKIDEPSPEKTRNNKQKTAKSTELDAYPKPSIDIKDLVDSHSQYLRDVENGFIKKNLLQPITNLFLKISH